MADEKNIYRVNFISRIENKHLRRALLMCIFPFLLVLNVIVATVTAPFFIMYFWWGNNKELFSSTALRWNVRKDD